MIYEYALEPELVASWHDRIRGRFFIDNFGSDTGRVVSCYPKKWKKHVWAAFDKAFPQTLTEEELAKKETARGRIEELIKQFKTPPVIQRPGDNWLPDRDWLANAEREHERKPFHTILAHSNPRQNSSVMLENDILDGKAERWAAPGGMIVLRNAAEMAKSVAPMLRCATRILFVDPYFDAGKPRFRNPLATFITTAGVRSGRNVSEQITFELHVSQASYDSQDFIDGCKSNLPSILPLGAKLTIFRWKDKKSGASVDINTHPRYILTDVGGVSFEKGLDEEDEPNVTDNVDVLRLPAEVYSRRWNDYAGPNFAFDLDGEAFSVKGRVIG